MHIIKECFEAVHCIIQPFTIFHHEGVYHNLLKKVCRLHYVYDIEYLSYLAMCLLKVYRVFSKSYFLCVHCMFRIRMSHTKLFWDKAIKASIKH